MTLSKGAVGNLVNRYRAVLKKCHLMNVFGSLAVAGMLIMGGAGIAGAWQAGDIDNKGTSAEGFLLATNVANTAVSYDENTKIATVSGSLVVNTEDNLAIQARVDKKQAIYPRIDVMSDVNLSAGQVAVSGQDGIVNIGSAGNYVSNIVLHSKFKAQGETDPTELYSAIFARNLFGEGQVNLYGKAIAITTEERALQSGKWGNAISGNGSGAINIHGTDKVTIRGAIESLNAYMQKGGTSSIKININQDAADTATVDMEGIYINAADKSEVNIKGADGSSVTSKLIASAVNKTSGGKININLAGDTSSYTGIIDAKNGGDISVTAGTISSVGDATGEAVSVDAATVTLKGNAVTLSHQANEKVSGQEYVNVSLLNNGGKVDITADKLTFNASSVSTYDPNKTEGTNHHAAVLAGNSEMAINVKELYIGSNEKGGDRGIRLTGANNKLTILADKIVSYTGDEFVHVRKNAANSVANIGTADQRIGEFEAHTTLGKGDYGVAILQANEGGTVNFYADKALFDGVTNNEGGVFGSGSYGAVNVDATALTINGNLCGTYGKMLGQSDKTFALKVATEKLDLEGNINAGSMGTQNSKMDRQTNVTVAAGSANITGNISAWERGDIRLDVAKALDIKGQITTNKMTTEGAKAASVAISADTFRVTAEDYAVKVDEDTTVTLNAKTKGVLTAQNALSGAGSIVNLGVLDLAGNTSQFTGTFSQSAGSTTLSGDFFGGNVELSGGALNADVAKIASGKAVNVSDGTITVAKSLDLSAGALSVSGMGSAIVAEKGTTTFGQDGSLTLSGGSFVADAGSFISDAFDAFDGVGNAVVGTSGSLNLRVGGAEYTAAQYNQAKDGLLGAGEDAVLNFLDGTLKVQDGEQVVIGGTVDVNNKVTLSGGTPVVAQADEAAKDAGAKIASVPDRFIQVVAADDADKALLTASSLEVKNSAFSAKGLQVNPTDVESGVHLDVTGGTTLTLVGGDTVDSSVIIDEGGNAVKTRIAVDGGATLNLGIAGNTGNQMASMDGLEVREGTVKVNGNGLESTQHTYGELTVAHENAAVNFNKATVVAEKATLEAGSVTAENAAVRFTELNAQNGSLQVLNSTAHIENLTAAGGSLFVDPAHVKVETLSGDTFDTTLLVGDGSVVEIGSIADIQAKAAEAGLHPTAFGDGFTVASGESMLALGNRIALGPNGRIVVDAGVNKDGEIGGTPVHDAAYFGDTSLLVVDSAIASGEGAIKAHAATDTITVKQGAKLYIVDAKANDTYTVASNFADASSTVEGWTGSDLVTNRLINAERIAGTDGTVTVRTTAKQAASLYPDLSIPHTLDSMIGANQNDVDSANAGIRFLSRAMEPQFLADGDVVPTIDGAAQLAYAGGVQASTIAVAQAPTRAIQDHLSLASNVAQQGTSLHEDGFDLWANALYGANRARDFSAGSLDAGYNSDFAGGVIGGDWTFGAGAGKGRVGLAFNVGTGDTKSRGDFNGTKNDFDFWGVSLYGGWSMDNINVVADFGYSASKNELKQDIPSSLGMGGKIKADVDSDVITAGVKAEYMVKTDVLDVMPHVGVRYMAVKTDSFSTKLDQGGDLFRTDGDLQHVWQFPVGVNLSKSFETESGWKIKPQADLSVVPAAGDTKTKIDVRTPGVDASDSMKRRVMDTTSFDGVFGVEVQKDNVSFGLGYNVQASEHQTGQGVTASFMYKF